MVLGCLFIGVIRSSLPLVGISAFWQMFINGLVILVAVLLSARQRRHARSILEARDMIRRRCIRWETMLALVLVLEFVLFSMLSPYFLDVDTLSDATFNFTERALVALPLALLIIAGEIDISVAAIIALSSVAMGFAADARRGHADAGRDRPRHRTGGRHASTARS